MKIALVLALILVYNITFSQKINYNNYEPLKSSGPIPDDFRLNSKENFESHLIKPTSKQKEEINYKKEKYIVSTYKQIDDLLKSGFVSFNDPISNYANRVLKTVLKNDKELSSKLRVYLLKSTNVNAASYNNGIILISVGLISQLQNEAQLAYILAHESIHYKNGHHIKGFLNREKSNEYKYKLSYDDRLNSYFSYSKDNELEADKEAFQKYYKNSGYSIQEAEKIFDILLYSYLPFDEIEFDFGIFESEYYKFPKKLIKEETDEISAIENYNDVNSTHPNILKRKKYVERMVGDIEQTGSKFIVSENEFKEAQKAARFELSYLYRIENAFEKAIYNSFLLLRSNPDNKYLKTNIGESLYGLNYYKNSSSYSKAHVRYKKIEGLSQRVNYFFEKIKKSELNIITLRYLWKLHNQFEGDQYINALADSTINEVAKNFKDDLSSFPTKVNKIIKDSLSKEEYEQLSKTDKIKYNKRRKSDVNYYFYSFVGVKNTFDLFEKYDKEVIKNNEEENLSYEELAKKRKKEGRKKKEEIKKGKSLGIDSVYMISPYFEMTKDDLKYNDKIKKYYKRKEFLETTINKIAEKINLTISPINFNNLGINETDKFNDYTVIKNWIYENYFQNNNNFIMASMKYLAKIAEKSKIKHLVWVGITYDYETPKYSLYVYEIKTGKIIMYYKNMVNRLPKDLMKTQIYYSLKQIKRKPKN